MSFFSPGSGRGYFWSGLSKALENIYETNKEDKRYELMKERDIYLNELIKNRLNEEYSLKKDLASQNFEYKKQLQNIKNQIDNAKTELDYFAAKSNLLKFWADMSNDNKIISSKEFPEILDSLRNQFEYVEKKLGDFKNNKTNIDNIKQVNTQQQIKTNIPTNIPKTKTNIINNQPKISTSGGFET